MEQCISEITEITDIGKSYTKLCFSVPWQSPPASGQFVSLSCGDRTLLKRPLSIGGYREGVVSVIFKIIGRGTQFLSEHKRGDKLAVLGPLGRGFPAEREHEVIYTGGGCGIPPLVYDISLYAKGKGAKVFAGFKTASETPLAEEFRRHGADVHIATEDGSAGEQGVATDILKNYLESLDHKCIIFASGPMVMQKKVADLCRSFGTEGYLCLERYMACGFGVCHSCVQPVLTDEGRTEYARVCTEGPVFSTDTVVWDT